MKTFLLIDDHEVVRSGIGTLLSTLFIGPQVEEAGNADAAIEKLKLHQYDLVMMDVQIPGCDMLGLMEFIHTRYPETKVLIFSMSAENIYAKRFLIAGAKGFLPKDASFEEMKKAITLVLNNKRYISENLTEVLADECLSDNSTSPFTKLSSREFEIASILLSGQTSSDLGKTLNLSPSSVGTYKKRVFDKLGVKNLLELNELATTYDFIKKT